jgi:hypothetical protein
MENSCIDAPWRMNFLLINNKRQLLRNYGKIDFILSDLRLILSVAGVIFGEECEGGKPKTTREK